MDKYCVKYRRSSGKYLVVLNNGWRYDGSMVVEADNALELEYKLAQARYDDRWVTMQGNHVLIGGNGRIKAGAGGRLKGRMFGMRFKDYESGKHLKNGKRAIRVYKSFNGKTKVVGKKASTQVQVTKHEDIKSALEKSGFKNIDASFLTKVDKKLAIENTNQLLTLERKFGAAKAAKITIKAERDSSIASVTKLYTNPIAQTLNFSTRYFNSSNNLIRVNEQTHKKDKNGRTFAMPHAEGKDSVYSITHEYGHILQNMLIAKRFKADGWTEDKKDRFIDEKGASDYANQYSYYTSSTMKQYKYIKYKWYEDRRSEVVDTCRKEIIAIAKKNNKNFKLKDNISLYGSKITLQGKAEFFAEVFANSQLGAPNELGVAMQQWLKQKGLVQNG